MAKPLSKLRIKIIEEIKANGGWPGDCSYCQLRGGLIEFYSLTGFYLKEKTIKTSLTVRGQVMHSQYMAYMDEETLAQPESVTPATKPAGLETLLSTWKAANEVVVEQEEKLTAAKLIADNAHKAVQEALGSFGWGKPALIITNAEDLLPGDLIRCIGPSWVESIQNTIQTVVATNSNNGHTYIHIRSDFGFGFEFVERPQLV